MIDLSEVVQWIPGAAIVVAAVTAAGAYFFREFEAWRSRKRERKGLRIPFQANPQALADGPVDPFQGTIDTPLSEVVVDGGPPRKVMREQAPLTAASQDVEDGV